MNTMTAREVNEVLESLGPVCVHLAEYRITHGYLHLLLTTEHFRRLADVYLTDCMYIAGPTSGGPWKCTVSEQHSDDGTYLVLSGGSELTIKALRAHATRRPGPEGTA